MGAEPAARTGGHRPGGFTPSWSQPRPGLGLQRDSSVRLGQEQGLRAQDPGGVARAECPSLEGSQVSLASSWSRSRACAKHTYGLSNSTSRYPRLLPTPSKITACCLLKHLAMRVFPSTRSETAWGGGTCPWAAGL